MVATDVNTEKVPGRILNVSIGYDASNGVNIKSGIKSFEYWREHDAKPRDASDTKASSDIYQPHSHYRWKLAFLSDCRVAFFATDVQVAGGNQFALVVDDDSNKIEYFKVRATIEDESGTSKTRTYVITDGYATKNRAYIGDDEDAIYEYEGTAKSISYSDA